MSELEHPEDIGGRLADTLAVRVRQRCSFCAYSWEDWMKFGVSEYLVQLGYCNRMP